MDVTLAASKKGFKNLMENHEMGNEEGSHGGDGEHGVKSKGSGEHR